VEFVTLLPLVVPAIVIVFGYLRLYGSDSFLPLTDTETGADALLAFGYVTLALPYIYRSGRRRLTAMDVRTLDRGGREPRCAADHHPAAGRAAQHPHCRS
jgi:putative spermidine/putrescine transport system permease protein